MELLFNITPDLADLEVRIHLDDLNLLLLISMQIILRKACPVKNTKHDCSQIVLCHLLFNFAH
jgi:hypothetical protein